MITHNIGFKSFMLAVGLYLISGMTSVFAEEVPWTDQFMQQFKEIKARIESLEKQQKEILDKEDKILEEIAQVRIWARR